MEIICKIFLLQIGKVVKKRMISFEKLCEWWGH